MMRTPASVKPNAIKVALDDFLDQNPALDLTENLPGFKPPAASDIFGGSALIHPATLILRVDHTYDDMTAQQQNVLRKHIANPQNRSQVAVKVAVKVFRFIPSTDGTNKLIKVN